MLNAQYLSSLTILQHSLGKFDVQDLRNELELQKALMVQQFAEKEETTKLEQEEGDYDYKNEIDTLIALATKLTEEAQRETNAHTDRWRAFQRTVH